MGSLKNIGWIGTGTTGLPILHKVLATGQFNCKLLVHRPVSSYPALPSQLASVHHVDFANHASLVQHLQGQDAVVVFSNFLPGNNFDTKHIALIDAAIEAGVRYFIPSEWAMDTAGIAGRTGARAGPTLPTNMVLAPKRVSHNYLLCRVAEKKINFAVIYAGVLFESCVRNGFIRFDFRSHTADLPDNGIAPFPASSLTSLARALISLLSDPSKIRNRFYHISDGVLTLQDMVRIIENNSGVSWTTTSFSIESTRLAAQENLRKGVFGLREFLGTLTPVFFGGMQVFTKLDNDVLGLDGEKVDLRVEVSRLAKERLEEANSQDASR